MATLVYSFGLFVFYLKYVPLVKPFQYVLIPILLLIMTLTAIHVPSGTFIFVFFFPLINSLPYFFGIYEPIPHAPAALVLFLFYFLGWLVHHIFRKPETSLKPSIFKPILFFSILVFLSAILTVFRYTNFYPFRSDYGYEFVTNVIGVTAGGAIMSIVFNSLNYLTGFALFLILLNTLSSKEYIKKILSLLLMSTFLSLAFALFQHFKDINFGNNPISFSQGIINGTFKDALSFGAYLSACIPLIAALIFTFQGKKRAVSLLTLSLAIYVLPHTGSRIGFAATCIFLFLFLLIVAKSEWRKIKNDRKKILSFFLVMLFVCIFTSGLIFLAFHKSKVSQKLRSPILMQLGIQYRWNYLWKMALLMIKDYPLTGVGIGAYIIELPNYAEINKSYYRTTESSENYFLQIGAELGVVGLFFSLWIYWEIFKQIKKKMRRSSSWDQWKYIQWGIHLGIISLFINFFLHSFIGSYEIIYTFWLLAALIFSSGQGREAKEF